MKCKQCVEERLKSTIHPGMSMRTLMGWAEYYDEAGRSHFHDPNITRTDYSCSNGHKWSDKTKPHLCWCQEESKEGGGTL